MHVRCFVCLPYRRSPTHLEHQLTGITFCVRIHETSARAISVAQLRAAFHVARHIAVDASVSSAYAWIHVVVR